MSITVNIFINHFLFLQCFYYICSNRTSVTLLSSQNNIFLNILWNQVSWFWARILFHESFLACYANWLNWTVLFIDLEFSLNSRIFVLNSWELENVLSTSNLMKIHEFLQRLQHSFFNIPSNRSINFRHSGIRIESFVSLSVLVSCQI